MKTSGMTKISRGKTCGKIARKGFPTKGGKWLLFRRAGKRKAGGKASGLSLARTQREHGARFYSSARTIACPGAIS